MSLKAGQLWHQALAAKGGLPVCTSCLGLSEQCLAVFFSLQAKLRLGSLISIPSAGGMTNMHGS